MNTYEFFAKLCHKMSQLQKAESRCAADNSKFNYNNYIATKRVLHQMALRLVAMTEE